MPIINEGWANALEPGIREWFFLGANRRASNVMGLFGVMTSEKAAEHMSGVGALSPDSWEQFSKTGAVPSVSFDAGYKKTFTNTSYVVSLRVSADLIADSQYTELMNMSEQFGDSATLKRYTDAASVFNNAFSSSFLGADGVALCSDSHPNGPTVSGTQDNNGTLSLTKANVRTVREAMQAFKDDRGNIVSVVPNAIVVPPALEDDAIEITRSVLDPNTGNNTVNPQFGRFSVITDHYLTDSNAWFMVDSVLARQSLKWFDREPLSIRLDTVEKTVWAVYVARMRYAYGWRDWRWVYGNNPS